MFDDISKMIREKKKREGQADLKPDMDYAGQEAIDPNEAWDMKQSAEVNEALGEKDPEPPSESEMGEHESSQDIGQLKKSMARIAKYIDSL